DPELDQFGTEFVFLGQLVQGLVEGEESVRRFRDRELDLVQVQAPPAAAALASVPVAGAVEEDAAHGFRGGGAGHPGSLVKKVNQKVVWMLGVDVETG